MIHLYQFDELEHDGDCDVVCPTCGEPMEDWTLLGDDDLDVTRWICPVCGEWVMQDALMTL